MTPIMRSALGIVPFIAFGVAACGDDSSVSTSGGGAGGDAATSSAATTGASGPSSSSSTSSASGTSGTGGEGPGTGGAGTGGTGTGGSGGAGPSGSGGGLPQDCDALAGAMRDWVDAHQRCTAEDACQRLDDVIPTNAGICDPLGAPGEDLDDLQALADAWTALGCETDGVCGFTPGAAVCSDAGTCTLEIDDDCESCPTELDPVCTESGENAVNECWAAECLQARAWEPGFCPDSAECTAAGGTCDETYFTADPPCADGTYWDAMEPFSNGCAGGNLRNECCIPWNQPCSYVASSNTLSLDPFTCAPPTGDGQPWTCLHALDQEDTCAIDGIVEQPLGPTYPADIVVTAAFGSTVHVEGLHENGSSFTCDGVVSFAFDVISTWSCEACDVDGECTTCDIDQTAYCAL